MADETIEQKADASGKPDTAEAPESPGSIPGAGKPMRRPAGQPVRPAPKAGVRKKAPPPPPKSKAASGKQAEAAPANAGNLGAVVMRNEFYRDGYRSLLRLAVIQSIVIVGLIAAMFLVINIHQPENRFFATTEDGRLIPMVPLSEPNLSTPALLSWSAQSVTEVMTFGFADYKRRLQESSRNFTKSGWESFTDALQRSRIIEMIETNQQVMAAVPRGAPILQSEGVVMGRYQWTVQVPVLLSYQSGNMTRSDSMLVTLIIVRVPRLESPNGIGIEQWIAVQG